MYHNVYFTSEGTKESTVEENKALLDRLCMSDSRQQSQMKTGLSIFLVVYL